MASHESYYNTPAAPPMTPSTSTGPLPPPKPQPNSQDTTRTSTPLQPQPSTFPPPSVPPHPSSSTVPPSMTPSLPPNPAQTPQQTAIPPPQLQDQWLPPPLPSLTISDLSPLLTNPQLLTSLSQTHPSYLSSLHPLNQLLTSNTSLAQHLSDLESQLSSLRTATAQLLLNHTSLQTQWRRKQAEMDDALSPWGPRAMYQRLVASIGEQEALLGAVMESFLEDTGEGNGGVGMGVGGNGERGLASEKEVSDWIKRIREGSAVLEKRREMRARWDDGRVGGWR